MIRLADTHDVAILTYEQLILEGLYRDVRSYVTSNINYS